MRATIADQHSVGALRRGGGIPSRPKVLQKNSLQRNVLEQLIL